MISRLMPLIILAVLLPSIILAETNGSELIPDSLVVNKTDSLQTPDPIQAVVDTSILIPKLEFTSTSLSNAFAALGRAYNLSLFVDSSVTGTISIRLDNVLLNDALLFMMKEYNLGWERTGSIVKIHRIPIIEPEPEPVVIEHNSGLITFDLHNVELDRFVNTLIDVSGRNIIIENNARGHITGKITKLQFEKTLKAILPANGFSYRSRDNVVYISPAGSDGNQARSSNLNVRSHESLLSLDVSNADLRQVIDAVASESGADIIIQSKLDGRISATFDNKSVEDALTYLLLNTAYTFTKNDEIYFIGDRTSEDMYDTRLIKLDHLIASNVESLIPVSLSKQLTMKVVKEHNGLVLTGPRTSIIRLESFIEKLDIPVAQVLFEVIVVDYTTTDRAEFGITANNTGSDSMSLLHSYFPDVDVSSTGPKLNDNLRSIERHLKIGNIGTLSDDFFIRLNAMAQEGKANIRSHPQIASLNGYPASIKIGTSQYYLLESKTIYPSQQTNVSTQSTQRFEIVEANMSLEVIPHVNKSGELIVEVKPEFNTPAESFNPDIPPTINHRILNSTVRLKDGETIVLGGMIQHSETATISKFPILGSLPLIGRLFQNHSKAEIESELMIYITPHIYYGSEGSISIDSVLNKR